MESSRGIAHDAVCRCCHDHADVVARAEAIAGPVLCIIAFFTAGATAVACLAVADWTHIVCGRRLCRSCFDANATAYARPALQLAHETSSIAGGAPKRADLLAIFGLGLCLFLNQLFYILGEATALEHVQDMASCTDIQVLRQPSEQGMTSQRVMLQGST